MKNFVKILCISFIALSSMFFGQNIENLKQDQTFINYLKNEVEMVKKIDMLNVEKIRNIIGDNEISENEKENLAKYCGFENFENFSNFFSEQNKSLQELNKIYKLVEINSNSLELILDSPEIYPIIDPGYQTYGDDCTKSCQRTGRNCKTAAFAIGVVEQIGCMALDSFLIGLACHTAAGIHTASELDECQNQMGVCIRGCKK